MGLKIKKRHEKSFIFFMDKFDLGLTFLFCPPGNQIKMEHQLVPRLLLGGGGGGRQREEVPRMSK